MNVTITQGHAEGELVLAGEMTIYTAAELAARLLPHPPGEGAFRVDLDGVSELDSAGVQILLMLRRALAGEGRALQVVRAAEPVADVLALCRQESLLASARKPAPRKTRGRKPRGSAR